MATKRKLAKVAAPVKQSAKLPNASRIDESRTSVTVPIPAGSKASKQVEPIEISSDSESNYDDISDLEDDAAENQTTQPDQLQDDEQDGNEDTEMQEEDQGEDSDAEPTFGDLIRNHETVDVVAALNGQQSTDASTAMTAAPQRQIAPPSTSSIGIVLAQALRTDDADLLESCLHTSDATVIRNTIQRLDSSLAGALITQLTSRLHRRPGRAHNLMTFVQWTLIGHGGALATQPDIQRRLAELNRVLEERTRGLSSLLALKGKLDMLEAQMTLRRGNKSRRASGKGHDESGSDVDEDEDSNGEDVVFVEGNEDESVSNGLSRRRGDDEDDDFPAVNGVASDSEDDSDDEDEDDMDVDELAQESLDEDEVDHDDIEEDSAEEDESEAEIAPPAKVQKNSRSSFSKRR
ncbi:hypothetical protein diail_4934 [Diaporthe ilicicola]|nr:hypothetical protein diail_4934 [Diaporthe ilicicola]